MRGYTLIELLVLLVIVGVISTMAYEAYSNYKGQPPTQGYIQDQRGQDLQRENEALKAQVQALERTKGR